MRKDILSAALVTALVLLTVSLQAVAQTHMMRSVTAGGAIAASGAFGTMMGTVGQPIIGSVNTGDVAGQLGFWVPMRKTTDVQLPLREHDLMLVLQGVFPNPSDAGTTLSLSTGTQMEVVLSVHDLLGRCVIEEQRNTLTPGVHHRVLRTVELPAGTYIVRARSRGFVQTQHLVVRH